MADSRDTSDPPTNVAALAEYDQHYRPYEVTPERDVGTMLRRVEEVLRHADQVFEHNPDLFSSTDYARLTNKYRSYLAEFTEEKRLRQTPIDDIVAQSPILSVLYAIKERGLDRVIALLRNVELFQSEVLAAIQPSSHRNIPVGMNQPASLPELSGSLDPRSSETVGPEPLEDQRLLAATLSQQLTSGATPGSSTAAPLEVTASAYRRKIIYENTGRRVEVTDAPSRLLNPDEQNQEMSGSPLPTMSEIARKWMADEPGAGV